MGKTRLLAIIEASTITGPAKNLLQFARLAGSDRYRFPVEVTIAAFQRTGACDLFLRTAAEWGIPVYPVVESGRFDRSVLARLTSLVDSLQPDLVQSHAVKSHFLVRKSGLHRRAPWIAFHHGYTWPALRARFYNQLDRWSLPAAARVLTVSMPFRQELIRRGVRPERIEVVHNAIDPAWGAKARLPEAQAELRARLGIGENSRVILIVGRLSREKDHATLLEALAALRTSEQTRGFCPHLLVVGDGPERTVLEERVRALHLQGAVTFTGQVETAEPFYGIADAAVLSSLSEGSPNALLEAMAARVPVVATRVGGVPEMVTHGESALLIGPRDVMAMTEALGSLLGGAGLAGKLVNRARELILARYAPEVRVQRLLDLYSGLADQHAAKVPEA
jgi:glycosyltransferase involved in cell wall biosynthesis